MGNEMDILYRRFMLVAALIAVMGVFTANLLMETRRVNDLDALVPGGTYSCTTQKTCFNAITQPALILLALSS